jgi:hypothetical protein
LCEFKISQSFTGSAGGILSLTCSKYSTRNIGISCQPNFALPILNHLLTFWKGLSWKPLLLDRLHWSQWALHQVKKWLNKKVGIFCYRKMTNIDSQGIGISKKKLNVCSIKLTSALTNPEHVCRATRKESGGRILTGECLLIWKQQTLMWGSKLSGWHHWVVQCQSTCCHEAQGLIYPVCQFTVSERGKIIT